MLKLFILISLFEINFKTINAGIEDLDWKEGNVVFQKEGFFTGLLYLDNKNDILLIKQEKNIKAYSVHKVKTVQYYDNVLKINREFVSSEFPIDRGKYKKTFLEIVINGKATIYRKEKINFNTLAENTLLNGDLLKLSNIKDYTYYLLINGLYYNMNNFKKSIFPIITQEHTEQIVNYTESNNLNVQHLPHQVLLIDYYNRLQSPYYKGLKNNLTARQ